MAVEIAGACGSRGATPWASHDAGTVALRQPADRPRVMLILPASEAAARWESLSRSAGVADTALWRRADIDAGIDRLEDELRT